METNNYLYYVTDKHERFAVWRHGITIKMKAEKIPFNIHWLKRIDPEDRFSFMGLDIRMEQVAIDPKMRCTWEFFCEFNARVWRKQAEQEFEKTSASVN